MAAAAKPKASAASSAAVAGVGDSGRSETQPPSAHVHVHTKGCEDKKRPRSADVHAVGESTAVKSKKDRKSAAAATVCLYASRLSTGSH